MKSLHINNNEVQVRKERMMLVNGCQFNIKESINNTCSTFFVEAK